MQLPVHFGDPARLGFDEIVGRAGRRRFEFHVWFGELEGGAGRRTLEFHVMAPVGFEAGETFECRANARSFDPFVFQ